MAPISTKNANENGVYEFPYMKPPRKTGWKAFSERVWNPSSGEFLGRTGKCWAQLLLFYTIFYMVLAALFAICMQGLLATIDYHQPTWQLDRSLIGTNPGLGFRPISERTEEGSLIFYQKTNLSTSQIWIDLLNDFMEPYNKTEPGGNVVSCDFNKPPADGEVCKVDIYKFGNCSPENNYGYRASSPCVFLKLNKIFGWIPEYYNSSSGLPGDMPEDLKEKIRMIEKNNRTGEDTNQVWISCQGEGPADKEHLNPKFEYFPTRGFPGYFYPYKNAKGYLSPLVAVQIVGPTPNVLINIECRAWAKNIHYRGGNNQREGSIHFEILMDNK